MAGIAQLVRASAFQAEGRGFESRFPLQVAIKSPRSSAVEHLLGKEEAAGSSPAVGSIRFDASWGRGTGSLPGTEG